MDTLTLFNLLEDGEEEERTLILYTNEFRYATHRIISE